MDKQHLAMHSITKNLNQQAQILEALSEICSTPPVKHAQTQNPALFDSVCRLAELTHANQISTLQVLRTLTVKNVNANLPTSK